MIVVRVGKCEFLVFRESMMTKLADFYDAFGLMMYPVTHPEDSQNSLTHRILK
jgi:hypothetical protein